MVNLFARIRMHACLTLFQVFSSVMTRFSDLAFVIAYRDTIHLLANSESVDWRPRNVKACVYDKKTIYQCLAEL